MIGLGESGVVVLLTIANDAFYRKHGKYRSPLTEDKRLPEPPQPAVPILKGVNKLKCPMQDTARNKRMLGGLLQPGKKIVNQNRYTIGGRCNMYDLLAAMDTNIAGAEMPGFISQSGHQEAVSGAQI